MKKGAGIALLSPAGELLLLRRAAWLRAEPETWCIPGGSLEPGESWWDAAKRETREEAGITVEGTFSFPTALEVVVFESDELTFATYIVPVSPLIRETHVEFNEESTEHQWVSVALAYKRQPMLHSGVRFLLTRSKVLFGLKNFSPR